MGANGKGNGKTGEGGAAPPIPPEGTAPNGKAPNGKRAPFAAETVDVPGEPEPAAAVDDRSATPAPAGERDPSDPPVATPGASSSAAEEPAPLRVEAALPAPRGEAWGTPLVGLERRWTWLESRLITFVLLSQILSLVAWVFLKGLSESVTTTAGTVFRALLLAVALGMGAWLATRKQPDERRTNLTLAAVAAGIGLVLLWRRSAGASAGAALSLDAAVVGYFDNVKGWLQEGSTLTLLGGLRGLATRLTLWLALLGGSLATATGKHINIDVLFRFLPRKLRVPITILNYWFAAAVCFAAVWGFFDHIAIRSYGAREEDRVGVKVEKALHTVGDHAFFTRKQLGLDLRSLPHVLAGERYDQWMSAAAWNAWVDGGGFDERWAPAQVQAVHITEGTHSPFVVSPDGETLRAALAHTLGLVFPFGLLAIALRFILRSLLVASGHYDVDPDEAHRPDGGPGPASRDGGPGAEIGGAS
jgi:Tripartite ATP-independent periplasmic transporters, DctQ component